MDTRNLKELAVNESGLIFNPTTGDIFTSNSPGIVIINALKAGKNINDIIVEISSTFDVDDETAEKDIFDFLGQLNNYGLVQETV